jgi:ppGpp synthetase/RelA/SpoT-type nucleotidyltranferase
MKVSATVRELYNSLHKLFRRLKIEVEQELKPYCEKYCHNFLSRLKSEESFAEKLECGGNIEEDFYAATIIVDTYDKIKEVEQFLNETFVIMEKRPKKAGFPDQFNFDGIRLYYKLKNWLSLPAILQNVTFEIQILTLLEHAWIHIFHDISYKTNDINWSKERLSYQIKTLLKNADMLIHENKSLAGSTFLTDNSDYQKYDKLKRIKEILNENWPPYALPNENIKRQCISISNLLDFLSYEIEDFQKLMQDATIQNKGGKLTNLSPFNSVIQALLDANESKLQNKPKKGYHILLADEIELPNDFNINNYPVFKKLREKYKPYFELEDM